MPRIQTLELPTVVVGEAVETPFALIIDQADGVFHDSPAYLQHLKEVSGAQCVLIFDEAIDIPANQ